MLVRRSASRPGAALALAAAVLAASVLSGAARADVAGVVVAGASRPVPQARVELVADGRVAFTDARGAFAFAGGEPPAEVRVSHPRFEAATFTVTAEAAPLVLVAKREVYDAIEVSAELGQGVAVPPTLAIADLDPAELAAPPASLAAIVATVPGVAESGQGGAFQVFSIRGVAGQRVLTRVSGAPLHGERRAGVETSFLDPLLVGAVEVVRGPSGTYQGAGALGGVVEVFPRRREGWSAELGWASQGDEVSAAAGWGGGPWSIAAAWRDAGDAETADGERLFSRFERLAASVERAWAGERADWTLVVVPATTRDIGKPNTDFPRRTTLYPAEDHLLASLSGLWRGGWHTTTWLHPHAVDTRTTEADGSRALVENAAFDLGA
ncbi:MAG TPA: TonB-dependent receptor, partial [Thermoanaerobaculia bacterium]